MHIFRWGNNIKRANLYHSTELCTYIWNTSGCFERFTGRASALFWWKSGSSFVKSCTDDFEDIIASLSWLSLSSHSNKYWLLDGHNIENTQNTFQKSIVCILFEFGYSIIVDYYDYGYDVLTLNPTVSTERFFPLSIRTLILWWDCHIPPLWLSLSEEVMKHMSHTWVIFWSAVWNC